MSPTNPPNPPSDPPPSRPLDTNQIQLVMQTLRGLVDEFNLEFGKLDKYLETEERKRGGRGDGGK